MTYTYDGSYEGLLSVIFETYRLGQPADAICQESIAQPELFGQLLFVDTNPAHARRVLRGVAKRAGADASRIMYHCFLSEQPDIEVLLYRFVRLAMNSHESVLENFREPVVLRLHRIERQIHREVHRMHAFVRFQETSDGLYAALITPDFNVLPLLSPHFRARYPAFRWLIYDTQRRFGLYHEDHATRFITLDTPPSQLQEALLSNAESDYQALWQTYFSSVDIPERRNMKLHLQHVPRRYWKYLVEKQNF
ncbi:MAG: TIGR03915 family putative DNA repair protein [Tunicatimonas sp.]